VLLDLGLDVAVPALFEVRFVWPVNRRRSTVVSERRVIAIEVAQDMNARPE
jgi:hypothetical protein